MSWTFVYEHDGDVFTAGWEMSHGMMWVSYGTISVSTPCGRTLDDNKRIRDSALHQILAREGLVSTVSGLAIVPIKYGWD